MGPPLVTLVAADGARVPWGDWECSRVLRRALEADEPSADVPVPPAPNGNLLWMFVTVVRTSETASLGPFWTVGEWGHLLRIADFLDCPEVPRAFMGTLRPALAHRDPEVVRARLAPPSPPVSAPLRLLGATRPALPPPCAGSVGTLPPTAWASLASELGEDLAAVWILAHCCEEARDALWPRVEELARAVARRLNGPKGTNPRFPPIPEVVVDAHFRWCRSINDPLERWRFGAYFGVPWDPFHLGRAGTDEDPAPGLRWMHRIDLAGEELLLVKAREALDAVIDEMRRTSNEALIAKSIFPPEPLPDAAPYDSNSPPEDWPEDADEDIMVIIEGVPHVPPPPEAPRPDVN